jgi:hypothetical protein
VRPRVRAPVAFVEIPTQPLTHAEPSGGERIELAVGGIVLRVPDRFEPQTLARVLEVVEARR